MGVAGSSGNAEWQARASARTGRGGGGLAQEGVSGRRPGEAEQDVVGDDNADVERRVAPLRALEVELGEAAACGEPAPDRGRRRVDQDVLRGDVGVDEDPGLVDVA